MIPVPIYKMNCQIPVKGLLFFRINNISIINEALINGKMIVLKKDGISHFVTFKTIKPNPKVDTKVLKNTAIEVPNIPQLIESG